MYHYSPRDAGVFKFQPIKSEMLSSSDEPYGTTQATELFKRHLPASR